MIGRRALLKGIAVAGAGGLLNTDPASGAAEPPPETKTIRLIKIPGVCLAPQYVAEELLRTEGFTDVQYVESTIGDV